VAGEPGRVSLVTKATSVRAIYPQTEASDDPSRPDSVDYAADKDGRLRSLPKDLGGRGKIRDVAIASRCLAALLGIVVTACGPVDVAPHVDWEGRTYIPGSICLDRFDVTDRALSVSASWEHGSVPARPVVGIQVEQAIAVDAEEWGQVQEPWVGDSSCG
jgi:hypothetical protein